MKKFLAQAMAVLATLSISTSVFAAPSDVSSTSNFTVTVVEETLGITISGSTTQSEVISKTDGTKQKVTFPNISITNSGNTKGRLYANTETPTGITWGSSEGQLSIVYLYSPQSNSFLPVPQTSESTSIQQSQDSDGDPSWVGPGEKLKAFDVGWEVVGKLPVGNITVPIKWTMKAN